MNLNEYKVLELMNRVKKPVFFRELSKKSGVSIGGTQQVLKNYLGFIEKKIEGRNVYYSFKDNLECLYLRKIIEIRKTLLFLEKNKKFKEFFNWFVKNNINALIFGSYAKGESGKRSDIDVLILSSEEIQEHLCPVKIHAISLTKKQFESAFRKKETIIKEIIDNHIVINGVDYFTNMFRRKHE